jgi:integrase
LQYPFAHLERHHAPFVTLALRQEFDRVLVGTHDHQRDKPSEKGVHPSTAQKILGHSDIRMTLAIYTHATDGMQDAATEALEEAFS